MITNSKHGEEIDRACFVCGTDLQITVTEDSIDGGYFVFTIPPDQTNWDDPSMEGMSPNRTETGGFEIWECPSCFTTPTEDLLDQT